MSQHRLPAITPTDVVNLLKAHPRRWFQPMLIMAAVAFVYTLVRPATWEASQALTVRDEAASSDQSRHCCQRHDQDYGQSEPEVCRPVW